MHLISGLSKVAVFGGCGLMKKALLLLLKEERAYGLKKRNNCYALERQCYVYWYLHHTFLSCIFSNSSTMFKFLTVNMMFYCTFQPRSKTSQVKFLCKGFNSWTFLCLCKVDSVSNLSNLCSGWRSVDCWEGLRHSIFVPGNPSIHDTFHPFCHPVWFRDNGYY